jgi:hypothetical protein
MAAVEKGYVVPGAVRCQACGAIFRHWDLWKALHEGAPSSVGCLKCGGSGPFVALPEADLEALSQRRRRVTWGIVVAGTAIIAAVLTLIAAR